MMVSFAFLAVLAVAQSSSPSIPSTQAKPKWSLDYAPNACILSRERAGTQGGFRMETRPFEVDHKFSLLLPKTGEGSYARAGRLSVPDPRPAFPSILSVEENSDQPDRLVTGSISDTQLAALAKQATLGVSIDRKLDERVSVEGLAKALLALDRCEEDLAQRWGTPRTWAVDPQPLRATAGLIRNSDYPASMVAANLQGSARLILQIDSSGQIQRCRAIEAVGPVTFAEVVCSAYKKRLRFAPAKDSAGATVPSYFMLPEIRFILAG